MVYDATPVSDAAAHLAKGIRALGLPLNATAHRRMRQYIDLVADWNREHRPNAKFDDTVLAGQVLGSLAALPHLAPGTLCDVGSGTGLPGIPLAIARPADAVTLVESNHTKVAFLAKAKHSLGLSNVQIVEGPVQSWPGGVFDTVVSRALCDLDEFVRLAGRLCCSGGTLAALKGVYPYEEMEQIPVGFAVREVIDIALPFTHRHHLVLIDPVC